jgi:hypothetical protein
VGQSCWPPHIRFKQHKTGYKASQKVKKYGDKLLPDLFEIVNPLRSKREALAVEKLLAAMLVRKGYAVFGGH